MTVSEERLAVVRQLMTQANYDALVVPRADEYLGEYLPLHNERLHWLSGFTGSAGMALVLQLRQLNLKLTLVRLGALRKDIEDPAVAIQHPALKQLLKVSLLARGQFVIEHDKANLPIDDTSANLLRLTRSNIGF